MLTLLLFTTILSYFIAIKYVKQYYEEYVVLYRISIRKKREDTVKKDRWKSKTQKIKNSMNHNEVMNGLIILR